MTCKWDAKLTENTTLVRRQMVKLMEIRLKISCKSVDQYGAGGPGGEGWRLG